MINKLYVASHKKEEALLAAWGEVYANPPSEREAQKLLAADPGSILFIGLNEKGENVYWAPLEEIPQCLKAMADFLPLLGDSLANWMIVDQDRG